MLERIDIDDLVGRALETVAQCQLDAPGRYKRYATAPADGRDDQLNEYGVADAANLLYTLGHFPQQDDDATRRGFVSTIRELQNAETGLWHEATHHDYHCTAHCIAALELFNAQPLHKLTSLGCYGTPEGIRGLLDGLSWVDAPWRESHKSAGVFASLLICDPQNTAMRDAYFDWLAQQWDPQTGLLRRDCLPGQAEGSRPLHEHMAGTFHYLFNTEADHRPLPHAAALVDTCLEWHRTGQAAQFARSGGFIFIDWVYCLTRAVRHSGHRFIEARAALAEAARVHFDLLRSIDLTQHHAWTDLHMLFGWTCAWAELQAALPGIIRTQRPLRLVLDRRPFI
ncbi:MAG TPA: hypothetical protein VGN72_04100 [Tepidisphaeraceae bacterium]|nr:hypothetical protein [Tepidisphaeraceae bacterium]